MRAVMGIDGCRSGWVAVERGDDSALRLRVGCDLEAWFRDTSITRIGIDIPIGLFDAAVRGRRACDRAARAFLGPKRASSMFSAPIRAVLTATDFSEAADLSRRSSPARIAISRQCFGIVKKIAQVDAVMTAECQDRIVEIHPECSFAAMNGGVGLASPKRRSTGRAARAALIAQTWRIDAEAWVRAHRCAGVADDDLLDAMAACWTAERVQHGIASRLPETPDRDARGLRMEIWV